MGGRPARVARTQLRGACRRLEVRDWIDVIHASERIQPLGYLAWAACGKDAGFSPLAILEHAARSTHYPAEEVSALSFEGEPPDAAALARRWHAELVAARSIVDTLPPVELGRCVLRADGSLFHGDAERLRAALQVNAVVFHQAVIRGAVPRPKAGD